MRRALILHPHSRCDAVERLDVEVSCPAERSLRLSYRLTGRLDRLRLSPRAAPQRRDELWRRTCFEAFIRVGSEYLELNLAPSAEWQAYRFDSYRSGRAEADLPPPRIEVNSDERSFRLTAQLSGLPAGPWRLNLAAVIEESDGRLSYWALAHPPGQPDFHHPDCFALDLPPPAQP